MKLKIKVKLIDGQKMPKVIDKGDWIDLRANKTVELTGPQLKKVRVPVKVENDKTKQSKLEFVIANDEVTYIQLGVAMKLPDGFEAIVAPRSSMPKKFGVTVPNSFGVIDNSYSGNEDEWKLPVLAFRPTTINREDRLCQFRIQLSQKATFWQKLKWFFSSGIEFVQVDSLDSPSRGGFGSTGNK